MNYYHVALDWNYFPVKPGWKTINGKVLMLRKYTLPVNDGTVGNQSHAQYLYGSTDITAGAGAISYTTSYAGSYWCYEDVSNQRMWSIAQGNTNGSYIYYQSAYETTLGTGGTVTPPNNTQSIQFFLGVDDLGFLHFVGVQDGSSAQYYSQYTFWKIHPTTYATTTIISSSYRSLTASAQRKSWPSNIRRAS